MARLETRLCGVELKSPFVLGSGPLSYSGEALVRASNAGAGAVVTKTIRLKPADNPFPHMVANGNNSLINCEKWADLSAEQWIQKEIPFAKKHGAVVVGSVGHTPEEAIALVADVARAGADLIELVSYREEDMVPMVQEARKRVEVPILAKLSPNGSRVVETAGDCLKAGANGITAIDSYGPVLRIDIATARPLLGNVDGFGWLSGAAIKPIALRYVAEIARDYRAEIVGLGGVVKAEDALEMLMAGASAVGVCSAAILRGPGLFAELVRGLDALMEKYGYASVGEVSGKALPNLWPEEQFEELVFYFDPAKCNECMQCVKLCPYQARTLADKQMGLDESECRRCGFCVSVCKRGALTSNKLGPI
ncbi:MAG: 4Fe-4S binding protein [Actinobacteria bacterium]|nr:4Fe-4S binding protein [Actinomycetota bacterium]